MDENILKSIKKIEKDPFKDWNLETASKEAGYSSFHFHRIFKAATGVTIFQYVRYKQMQLAAKQVIMGERFEDIAYQCNFSSTEAFSRAFKNYFGKSPKEFQLNPDKLLKNYEINQKGVVDMDYKIVELKNDIITVGVAVNTSPPFDFNISSAWKKLSEQWENIVTKPSCPRSFGLQEYREEERSRPGGIIYTACVEVTDGNLIPEGMIKRIIPAGAYAVFTHIGPTENLDKTFSYIYTQGLNNKNFLINGYFDIEVYDDRFKEGTLDSELDIYVPVKLLEK